MVVGWLLVVGCWLLDVGLWLSVGRLVGRSVVGSWFGWFVAPSWWLVGLFRAAKLLKLLGTTQFGGTKLLPTTWNHLFGLKKEVVGSWWWHVVAWLVGWSLGG